MAEHSSAIFSKIERKNHETNSQLIFGHTIITQNLMLNMRKIMRISLEESILDKLGEKSINWEYLGNNYNNEINRITYEEVIDDTRPIQTKKVLGVEVATRTSI